ncbi:hypothetical protein BC332_00629 [Capsicum chinense]|nr:hypothetical protein BC332_00629 [Capsicum chinense]
MPFWFIDFKFMSFRRQTHVDVTDMENKCSNRRWVQAVFRIGSGTSGGKTKSKVKFLGKGNDKPEIQKIILEDSANETDVDISEGMALEMFGISSPKEEILDVVSRDYSFKIKLLSKEYQHTCKSTGLILWESARLMASVLAANQTIVSGRRVLELGCGCAGICSMVAARSANLVVATDGDTKALDLLNQNLALNLQPPTLITKKLEWGNRDDVESIKRLNGRGFDVIIGTDVTYVADAISPLFATAKELIRSSRGDKEGCTPALILCHVLRRVDEPSILSAASEFGFKLVDRWPNALTSTSTFQNIIQSWFAEGRLDTSVPTTALNILYFHEL